MPSNHGGGKLCDAADHVMPSVLVRTFPVWERTMYWLPVQTTPSRRSVVPEVREVHVVPSGLVMIAPATPTATNCPLPYATPRRLLNPPLTFDHVMPSALVAIRPLEIALPPPTVTKRSPKATPRKVGTLMPQGASRNQI